MLKLFKEYALHGLLATHQKYKKEQNIQSSEGEVIGSN